MNDERDHDTEHIEKFLDLGKKKESKDDVDDASSTHNSTDGTANRKSGGWGVLSGWRKQADGQVEEPTYEGKDSGPTFETITPLNMGGAGPKPDENKPPETKTETEPKEDKPKTDPEKPPVGNTDPYTPLGGNITPDQIAQYDARQDSTTDTKKEPEEFDPYGDTKTDEKNPDMLSEKKGSVLDDTAAGKQQSSWKPSVTSQRMMDAGLAGLNMFGGIMGGANKAFSMLRGLASALTSRQLMSDPTLPARGFLNAMEQSGQIVEDHIRQVGEAYGIKDGVKRDDLVGTYKGAQYYREKQQIENAEKQYYAGVGNALSAVLGNNVDVNDTVGIQNALAQMSPQQLSQLDDALFGQNGSLKDMYEATVVNPMGSTREQKARAQLLTTLNQSLKGQAQANAREAGRQRTQANQQIQQANQQSRQIKLDQTMRQQDALQATGSPHTMPSGYDEQLSTIITAALGNDLYNKKVRMTRVGNTDVLDTNNLTKEQLGKVVNFLENSQLLGDPSMQAAQDLYNEASQRMFTLQNDRTEARRQFREEQRQSRLAPYMDSPLDYDILDRKNERDDHGIPTRKGDRERLYNNAWDTMQDLIATGGPQDDIDLCRNVMMTCDMSYRRSRAIDTIEKMRNNGMISQEEAEMARRTVDDAYNDFAMELALTMSQREASKNSGTDWKPNAKTDQCKQLMEATEEKLRTYKERYAQEQKDLAQAQRDEELRDYINSPIDMAIRSGKGNIQRDEYGIPKTAESRRTLYNDALNTYWRLTRDGGSQNDIALCDNVMRMCNMADRRDKALDSVRSLFESGAISGLERGMLMDTIQSCYTAMADELAVTKDERDACIANDLTWTDSRFADRIEEEFGGLENDLKDIKTGHDREVRERRQEQERDRREAQRAEELAPYQNSILDLQIKNGRGNTKRDSYGIPTDRTACRNLRDDAFTRLNELVASGASEEDVELCANVHALCEAALKRDQINSTIDRLERAGKITKEQAQTARQNAYNKYTALANRLPVTVDRRNEFANGDKDWKQDVDTDMLMSDLEGTMDYLGFVESDYDETTRRAKQERADRERQARARQREQERKDRAAERARAAQAEKDAKTRADEAEWEEHAMRDDRGISLSPWGVDNNKYRKKDIADAQAQLAKVERALEALVPGKVGTAGERMALNRQKDDLLRKIRRTCQEDHIQKLIAKANQLDPAERDQVVQAATALRDRFNDWSEFGKNINQIYQDHNLGSDRAWASTKRQEEGARKKARDEARNQTLQDILQAVRGTPEAIVKLTGQAFADPNGDINKGIDSVLKRNNLDLKKLLLGSDDATVRSAVRTGVRQALGMKASESIRDIVKGSLTDSMSDVTERLDNITDAVANLNDNDKSGIIKATDEMRGAVDRMTDFITGVFTINGKTGQYANINDLKNEIMWMQGKANNLLTQINMKMPTGGPDSPQSTLDPATLKTLDAQGRAIKTLAGSIKALNDTVSKKGTFTEDDLKTLFAVMKIPEDGEEDSLEQNDLFGPDGVWRSEDDYNEFMNMVRFAKPVLENVYNFMQGNKEQGLPPGVPVWPLDDAADKITDGYIEEKKQDLAQQDQNDPSGAAYDDAREDASETGQETVPEATGPEVEEQVDQSVEEPQTGTEEGGNDRVDFSTMTREQMDQHLKEKFPNLYKDMRNFVDEPLDMEVLEGWEAALGDMVRYPLLNQYFAENPEVMKGLYRLGKDGVSIHQTFKGQIQKAMDHNLFNGEAAEFLADYAEDLLSQTSRDDLRATARDWRNEAKAYTPEQAQLQSAVINNIEDQIETSMEGILRKDAERRLSMPPNDADVRTNGYQATDDMRRTIKIMAESMAEEAELKKQGLDEGQIKQKMAESQAEQKRVAEAGTKAIVPEQQSEVGKRMAESVRDTLFYSKKGPQWADYRSVMDRLADMRSKYPQAINEIDRVRDDIVLGMVVPQLMGFKNVANVAPTDKLSMDKIKEISRRAMEFGLAKRQEVTDRANEATLAGKDYKFSKEDEYWLGFPTVDELVDSHIYGRNSDKDPVNINRARVHRQEEGNKYNNRLRDVYKVAKKEATIRDNIQAKVDELTSEAHNPFIAYNKKLGKKLDYKALLEGTKDTLTNRTPIETIRAQYVSGELTPEKLDTMISQLETAKRNALDYKKMINSLGSTLYTDTNLKIKDGEGGEVSLPEDALEEINNVRRAKRDAIVDQDWVKNGLSKNGEIVKYIKDLKALRKTDPKQNVAQEETPTGTDIVDDMDISEEEEDAKGEVDDTEFFGDYKF